MTIHAQQGTEHLLIAPQAMTNSATVTANFDTYGGNYATIRIPLASEINTNATGPTISLLESDDTVVTNFATFNSDFERADEDITNAKEVVYHVDCRTRKRYLRLSVTTETTTNDDVTVSALGTLTRNAQDPASAAQMAGSTNDAVVVG